MANMLDFIFMICGAGWLDGRVSVFLKFHGATDGTGLAECKGGFARIFLWKSPPGTRKP
jgi:hypothetical protein